jgi:hypothetical protein
VKQRQIRRERAPYLFRLLPFACRPAEALVVWTGRSTIVSGVIFLIRLDGHRGAPGAYEEGFLPYSESIRRHTPFTRRKRWISPFGEDGGTQC